MAKQEALTKPRSAAIERRNSFLQGENSYPATVREYLSAKGLPLERAFRCLSPSHADAHPSMRYDARRDKVHCFACGATFDLVDLLVLDGVAKRTALRAKYGANQKFSFRGQKKLSSDSARTLFEGSLPDESADSLKNSRNSSQKNQKNDYWASRGLSEATIERFGLSDDEDFAYIPYGGGYVLRRGVKDKRYYNPRGLPTRPYDPENAEGFVVAVEGAIDCVSILQAAGDLAPGPRVCCAALSSASNFAAFALAARTDSVYCLALDNDSPGKEAALRLAALLKRRGVRFFAMNLYGAHKDANEALCKDRAALTEALGRARAAYAAMASGDAETRPALETPRDVNDVHGAHDTQCVHDTQDVHCAPDAHEVQHVRDTQDVHGAHDTQCAQDTQEAPLRSNAEFLSSLFAPTEAPALKTGLGALDALTGGLPRAGLTVLGAPSAAGKTTLCLHIADNIAQTGMDVLFFTFEMSRRDLTLKSLSRETALLAARKGGAVPANEIAARKGEDSVRAALAAYAGYAGRVFMIEPDGAPSPELVERAVLEHVRAYGRAPFVVVDYLQLLRPADPYARSRMSDKQALDYAVASLKRVCRASGATILAVSSLNRQSYGNEISMESFKESGSIEYSADLLLGMRTTEGCAKHDVTVSALKNRFGPSRGAAKLAFYPAYACFE